MNDDIRDLKLQIFELKAEVVACNIRLKAFQDCFAYILEEGEEKFLIVIVSIMVNM